MAGVLRCGATVKKVAPDLSNLPALLDNIAECGYDGAELPLAELNVILGGRVRREGLAKLVAICRSRPMHYTAHGPMAVNLFVEPGRLERNFAALIAAIDVASELGTPHLVVHSGYVPLIHAASADIARRRQRDCLARAGDLAGRHGVTLCVENIFPGFDGEQYTLSPSQLAEEIRIIQHPQVMATLDFSHARLHAAKTGGAFLEEIAALAPLACHLHLHDCFGRPDDSWAPTPGERAALGTGDLHLPIGWGDTQWEAVFERCAFPDGVVLNAELAERYTAALPETAGYLRRFAAILRQGS